MSPARAGWLLPNLLAQLAFGLLAMTACIPSMQQWSSTFGVPQAQVQLTFSGYVVAYGLLQMVYGPLSDRHGRRPVLLAGLGLAVAGSVLAALAQDITSLVLARVLQGAGSAAGMVVGRALVQDHYQGPQRTRVMAWVGMAMGLCPPTATIVGGQLHVHLGWQAGFWLMALVAAGLWAAAWWGLPQQRPAGVAGAAGTAGAALPAPGPPSHALADMAAAYARLARTPGFLPHVAVLAMSTATFYAFLSGAPLALGALGVGPGQVGFYIMATPLSYIVGNWLTTRLVRRLGDRGLMAWGQLATLASLLLLLVMGLVGPRHPLAFALPLTLLGLGQGLFVPAALAGTVGLVPALAGAAAGAAGLAQQLVGAAGGYAVGWLPHSGQVPLAWLMLVPASLGALAQWHLHTGLQRRAAR